MKRKELEKNNEPKLSKLSEGERVILKNLDKRWKWIVRNENGELNIFEEEPFRSTQANYWVSSWETESDYLGAFSHLFKFINFEDEYAYNIEQLLE